LQNVVVEKGDSSLLAQKMTLLYDEEQKREGKSAVKRIDAWDNVKIFSEDFIASGDEGHYDPQKDIFVLEKNVVVNNGSSIASGEKFIYDLTTKKGNFIGRNEETSIVRDSTEPQDRRVVVVIGGELKDQKKQKKKSDEQNIKRQ
jgi:lipopolysaccharide transport protein LptA